MTPPFTLLPTLATPTGLLLLNPVPRADAGAQIMGEINAAGAIALARTIDTSRPVGTWWLANSVSQFTTIGEQTYSWSANIVWGDNVP